MGVAVVIVAAAAAAAAADISTPPAARKILSLFYVQKLGMVWLLTGNCNCICKSSSRHLAITSKCNHLESPL